MITIIILQLYTILFQLVIVYHTTHLHSKKLTGQHNTDQHNPTCVQTSQVQVQNNQNACQQYDPAFENVDCQFLCNVIVSVKYHLPIIQIPIPIQIPLIVYLHYIPLLSKNANTTISNSQQFTQYTNSSNHSTIFEKSHIQQSILSRNLLLRLFSQLDLT